MIDWHTPNEERSKTPSDVRDWIRILAKYRDPDHLRSVWVLLNTFVPYFVCWIIALQALETSVWLGAVMSVPIGFFLMRIFCIQHDCGHHALFRSRPVNNWVGRAASVFTITPYATWRRMHDEHHSSSGNLDTGEMGEVKTLTVKEYTSLKPGQKALYRAYRNPLFLFGAAPFLLFFLQYRLPFGLWKQPRYWASTMALNLVLSGVLYALFSIGGWTAILAIYIPSTLIGATAGVFTFYVQHQFEHSHWAHDDDWQVHDAAIRGSSYIELPALLAWFTANISIHHIHHLYAKIPFYRLPEVMRDYPIFLTINRMTLADSLRCVRFHLWDETSERMVSFTDVKTTTAIS